MTKTYPSLFFALLLATWGCTPKVPPPDETGAKSNLDGGTGTATTSTDCEDDADCDGVLAADDCDDENPALLATADDADCDGIPTDEDCDDNSAVSTSVAIDADCDSIITAMDCDDSDAEVGAMAADADCDGVPATEDCDDGDAENTLSNTNDADCDGTASEDDCDDQDATSSVIAADGDCDGVLTADDCDDADDALLASAEDMDCDGILVEDDCDDTDSTSTTTDIDGDCDGITIFEDCDDANNLSTSILLDGDCDGVLTALDCNDADATSTTIATDGDCDGVLTAEDCDDSNANVLASAEDADCDGIPTIEDCDDNDSSLAAADDADCDGITNEEDNCPNLANADQHDPDGDGFGSLCDEDENDFAIVHFPAMRECESNADCPADQICRFDESDNDSYCYQTQVLDGQVVAKHEDCITDTFCLTRDPWGGPLHNSRDNTLYNEDTDYDWYDSNTTAFADWALGNPAVAAHFTGQGDFAGLYHLDEYWDFDENDPFNTPYVEAWADELLTWDGVMNWGHVVGHDLALRIQTPPECIAGEDGGPEVCPFEFACTPGEDGGADQCPEPQYEFHSVLLTGWTQGYRPDEFRYEPSHRERRSNSDGPMGGRTYGRAKSVHFRKAGFATGEAKSDCITPSTCIARDSNKSLYNSAQESAYGTGSVKGVTFALGATRHNKPENYTSFNGMHNNNPQSLVWGDKSQAPQIVSMHVLEEDLYYDVVFLDFGNGGQGAPFEYIRTRALVPGCTIPGAVGYNPAANLEDNTCGMERFMKPNYADTSLPENQLCLSDHLCLTRAHAGPLFNAKGSAVQEVISPYNANTPQADALTFEVHSDSADGPLYYHSSNLEYLLRDDTTPFNYTSPNYTNNEYQLRYFTLSCDAQGGLQVHVNGVSSSGAPGAGIYTYIPGATLSDFDTPEELTAGLAEEPDDSWLHPNSDHINVDRADKSGVVLFDGKWFDVAQEEGEEFDFAIVAIAIIDTSTVEEGDAGVSGSYASCSGEIQAAAIGRSWYEDDIEDHRWAVGATHQPECTYEQMERDETIHCFRTDGYDRIDNFCDDRFDCDYPAVETCNGAGRCVWKESYLRNNYATLGGSLDWPQAQMPTNHGFAMSLYDCAEDSFYDVRFLRWTSKGKGGGFELAYTSVEPPSWYTPGDIRCTAFPEDDYLDDDSDGVFDHEDQFGNADNCPDDENTDQADADADGVGDACDNCVDVANPGQEDADGNDVGNHCQVLTLNLDTNCYTGDPITSVRLSGPWWGWDPNGGPVATDEDEDGIYTVVMENLTADMEYKWVINGAYEDILDNASESCVGNTDNASWANRVWTWGTADRNEVFGQCEACATE